MYSVFDYRVRFSGVRRVSSGNVITRVRSFGVVLIIILTHFRSSVIRSSRKTFLRNARRDVFFFIKIRSERFSSRYFVTKHRRAFDSPLCPRSPRVVYEIRLLLFIWTVSNARLSTLNAEQFEVNKRREETLGKGATVGHNGRLAFKQKARDRLLQSSRC